MLYHCSVEIPCVALVDAAQCVLTRVQCVLIRVQCILLYAQNVFMCAQCALMCAQNVVLCAVHVLLTDAVPCVLMCVCVQASPDLPNPR